MERDEIIKLARESCDQDKVDAWHNGFWTITQEELERFFHMAQAAERERIAKKIEKLPFGDTSQSFAVWVRQDVP